MDPKSEGSLSEAAHAAGPIVMIRSLPHLGLITFDEFSDRFVAENPQVPRINGRS
jgi:hypothetical protein